MAGEPSVEELERAGIPSRRTVLLKVAGVIALGLAIAGGGYHAWYRADADAKRYANVVARLAVPTWGEPVTAAVNPSGKATLLFVLRASSYTWSGRNWIRLRAEGLSQGKVVATVDCRTSYFKDRAWSNQLGVRAQYDECNMRVPAGGLDAVRATLRLENPGSRLDFENQVLEVVPE